MQILTAQNKEEVCVQLVVMVSKIPSDDPGERPSFLRTNPKRNEKRVKPTYCIWTKILHFYITNRSSSLF